MDLTLYNTLSRSKERFEPIDPLNVRVYVCGPTVYDFAHIGNARPVIVFDVLFRLLRTIYGENHVKYVRNVTDVDDKINARAAEQYPELPPVEAIRRLTEETYARFSADVAALGCLPPSEEPRATGHIAEMVEIIARLVDRGFAYAAEGHVLFHVPAMPGYGGLSRRPLDDMIAGARVEVAPYKRDSMDFVLWKPSGADEPGWDSPWGRGRPGWHIECSAMSFAELVRPFGGGFDCDDPLKNTFDIHGGGIDLVFPHHENEIAQTCCAFSTPRMANIWMHNGFLQVEGEKMSKSLGNFLTIRQLLDDWPGEVLRFNMLQTHYRQPINWTTSRLQGSAEELSSLINLFADSAQYDMSLIKKQKIQLDSRIYEPLMDDLDTPGAITGLRAVASEAKPDAALQIVATLDLLGLFKRRTHLALSDHLVGSAPPSLAVQFRQGLKKARAAVANNDIQARERLAAEAKTIGLSLEVSERGEVTLNRLNTDRDKVEHLIAARLAARKAKNFAESDRIRDELSAMGVTLKDGKDPVTGEPVTSWEVKR